MTNEFDKVVPNKKEAMIQGGLFLLANGASYTQHMVNSYKYGLDTRDANNKEVKAEKGLTSVLPAGAVAAGWMLNEHPILSAILGWRLFTKGPAIKPWKLLD